MKKTPKSAMDSGQYSVALALAGHEMAGVVEDFAKTLRAGLTSGDMMLSGDETMCQFVAQGLLRLESAALKFRHFESGKP